MSKRIIIGITGSIAAFKAIQLISDLVKMNYTIDVLMSESATKFITPLCIQSLTKSKVYVDTFDEEEPATITHVDIAAKAEAFMIVPASANTIAKVAYGMADNMLTCAFLASTCPKIIAPAMNIHMYQNPITQRNIQILKDTGVYFVEPDEGLLACGDVGQGKLASESKLIDALEYVLAPKPLLGKKVLVSAGPTQEAMDPVRYITNHSSGKMGYAVAKAAYNLGADVTLVSGPTYIEKPFNIKIINVMSALQMFETITSISDKQDYLILAAAVGDYRPKNISNEKIKKNDDHMILDLEKNKDILYYLGQHKKDHQILCGFAMETNHLIENAKTKLEKKNCDMIVANNLKVEGAGFETNTNVVTLITKDSIENLDIMSKKDLAYEILERLMKEEDKKC
ncbi:MAG: bifunctional phosphopantothenoylcysteine decarboxylase/phosphopantothenate--cysteine ligase CoaBC [Erysipelotrichaceae bacterium]|nr:bifunctional phosphopantothenoylcysteine decarboxylase/phosphopantothenate--cysteine ligase CoaBC [Erysipelotrichaceae bacterium]